MPRRCRRAFGRRSLRARVLLLVVGLLAIGLLVSDAVVLASLRAPLVDRVDNQLRSVGRFTAGVPPQFLAGFGQPPQPSRAPPHDPSPARPLDLVGDLYIAYLAPDGRIEQSGRAGAHRDDPPPTPPTLNTAAIGRRAGRPFDLRADDGTPWRVLALPRTTGNPGSGLLVAASLDEVDATVHRVRSVCLVITAATLALLTLLGFFAVKAGLRPLRRIEETSVAIAGGDLGRRVPDTAGPDTEIGRLSSSLNGMLAQIETAVAARAASEATLRRFVADASHELRTPLTGIKGLTELYRMGALPERADVDRAMDRIERESTRLGRLVEDLLLLARLDEGAASVPGAAHLRPEPMDLRSLAADALHDLRALDPTRPVRLTGPDGEVVSPAPTMGDERRLRQVVTNLIGNTVAHTPAGTAVRIGVGTTADGVVLEVADAGPGLTDEQARRAFERFYRADGSRSRNTGAGAGLGLAIAQSLAQAHGGRLELSTAPGAGATFRLLLPARTDDPPT
ncbi:HAMP domain-containing protein [Streptomyces sp. SID3343]|nr:HAMP domain-containing sensor histidine kinase [Streptomyces sp. SID3343]MYV97741.1 HAMP domain-containing protein [Streptomyces sp. SID3343]MYW06487.1 HAMP domain-containing protein [Streptomyces sp. SID3343]